jgi:hypothetical protein
VLECFTSVGVAPAESLVRCKQSFTTKRANTPCTVIPRSAARLFPSAPIVLRSGGSAVLIGITNAHSHNQSRRK